MSPGCEHVPGIEPELLRQELDSRWHVVIIDVRSRAEYRDERGHIPKAVSIPMSELLGRWRELEAHKTDRVVVVSERGFSSRLAGLELEFAGFDDVRFLEGGMNRWWELGYAVERCPRAMTS